MTTSPPEIKTGLRLGLAALAATGCLVAVLAAGLPVRAAESDPVLAKVNGSEIHASDVALAEEELGPSLQQMDPSTRKDNVLSFLIDMKIVSKAAEDKKIENNDDFKKRLAFTRNRLLMDSLLASEGKAATTDDAMKKVYDEASKQITGEQEVRARHILVETEDEAKAIKAELDKGADFAELAKKKSKDPGASDGGGEAIQALLNGTAQASAGGFADIYPQVEAGRLRALGVVAAEPLAGVEEIPTLRSQGYDVTLTNWRALFVPPGVSAEERTELEALIAEAVDTPEWKEAVQRNYWNPVPLSGAELEEFIAAEKERIGTLTEEIK